MATEPGGRLHWQRQDVAAGGSFRSQQPNEITFGLGKADHAAEIVVRWLDGAEERFANIAADRSITVERGRGVVETRSQPSWPRRHVAAAYAEAFAARGIEAAEEGFPERGEELLGFETELGGFIDAYVAIREWGADEAMLERVARFWARALPDLHSARRMEVIALRSLGRQEDLEWAEWRLLDDLDRLEGLDAAARRRIRREAEQKAHEADRRGAS